MFGSKSEKKCDKKEQERICALSNEERRREYEEKGREAWNRAWEILNTEQGWKDAAGSDQYHTGKVYYQHFPDIGRVFKLQGIIPLTQEKLFEEVVANVEQNPKWNPTVIESKIVEEVDSETDICHNITAAAAGGLVASRDFVSVRHWHTRNEIILSAGVSVPHPKVPLSKKYVRGEQKPGGWAFKKVPGKPNRCEFFWIQASDLKGWLPPGFTDSMVPGILLDFMNNLRAFALSVD